MSISKKGNKYYAAVYRGLRSDGKQDFDWSKGFDKKEDAQLVELEMKKIVIENKHIVYDKANFGYVSSIWLKTRKETVAPRTYRSNYSYYNTYIKAYFSSMKLADIEPIDVTNYMLSISKYSPATINKAMNILKLIFDFSISMKYIRHNPCEGIKKPQIKRTKQNTWTPEQISKFLQLEDTKKSTAYLAFLILFTTGMRPGEVCGLRWCDYHDDHFTPMIGIDEKRKETSLKNEKAHESVYIPDSVIAYLKKYKTIQKAIYLEHGLHISNESFINCLEPDMRPMTVNYLRQRLKKIISKNNLEPIRLYDSRHSFGTNMMRNDVNPKKVAELMRHSTVKTTLDNYSHTDEKMKKDTINMYNIQII